MKKKMVLRRIGALFQMVVGSEPDLIIWVSPKLVKQAEDRYFLEFPAEDVDLVRGKSDLILRPGSMNLFNVRVERALYGAWDKVDIEIDTGGKIYSYQIDYNHQAALVLTESSTVEYRWKMVRVMSGGEQIVKEGFGIVELDGTVMEAEGNKEDALASLD